MSVTEIFSCGLRFVRSRAFSCAFIGLLASLAARTRPLSAIGTAAALAPPSDPVNYGPDATDRDRQGHKSHHDSDSQQFWYVVPEPRPRPNAGIGSRKPEEVQVQNDNECCNRQEKPYYCPHSRTLSALGTRTPMRGA